MEIIHTVMLLFVFYSVFRVLLLVGIESAPVGIGYVYSCWSWPLFWYWYHFQKGSYKFISIPTGVWNIMSFNKRKILGGCWLSQPSDDFLTQRHNSHVGWVHEHIVWFKRKRGTSLVDRPVVIELGIKFRWTWIQTRSLWVSSVNLNRPSADVGNGEQSVSQWTVFLDFDCLAWFLTSAAKLMRPALFCAITRLIVVISYRRFRTTSPSHLHGQEIQETLSWIYLPWPRDREVVPKRR